MRATYLLIAFVLALSVHRSPAQGIAYSDGRLPQASIELKPHDPPATSTPWRLPKPGDPLYDRKKEAETRNAARTHTVHVFERGVFKGYATLNSVPAK